MNVYKHTVAERLMRYVKIDTTADPNSKTFPSSEKQKNLARLLVEELRGLNVLDAQMDQWGYVTGTIEGNVKNVPTICFCAHMDTAPDCSGTNVKPILHINYNGDPIILPDDHNQIITTEKHPYLKQKIGDDIITASGLTLLGADDKAGISCIMDLVQYYSENSNEPHGDIKVLFTPDEEVGRGVDKLDVSKLNADFAYTLDGGKLGSIEDESFSADAVKITINGISAHPGYAKGKLSNAIKISSEIIDSLPKKELSPETTEGRQGFVHPVSINGIAEKVELDFIIRDYDSNQLKIFENQLKEITISVLSNYPGCSYEFQVQEQYRNMKEVLDQFPFVTEYAIQAMNEIGIQHQKINIRGGTDGSRLSFLGLPCPNIFTGEMAIHSKHEYCSVQDMEKAVKTMIGLCKIWTKHKE